MGEEMTKTPTAKAEGKRRWSRPTLNRLGTITDVAGNASGACQGGGTACQAGS
jgi:hypothetical protein